MLSRTARRVYLVCAILALALTGTWIGTIAAQVFSGTKMLPHATAVALSVVLFPEVVGTALLWVAMLYFWFGFDRSHWLARAIWFPFIYFFLPPCLALYCFFVYRKWSGGEGVGPAAVPPRG
jgi:hypothetical protein